MKTETTVLHKMVFSHILGRRKRVIVIGEKGKTEQKMLRTVELHAHWSTADIYWFN